MIIQIIKIFKGRCYIIHKNKTPQEIFSFARKFKKTNILIPCCCSINLFKSSWGVLLKMDLNGTHANHLLRAAILHGRQKNFENEKSFEIEKIIQLKMIINLVKND